MYHCLKINGCILYRKRYILQFTFLDSRYLLSASIINYSMYYSWVNPKSIPFSCLNYWFEITSDIIVRCLNGISLKNIWLSVLFIGQGECWYLAKYWEVLLEGNVQIQDWKIKSGDPKIEINLNLSYLTKGFIFCSI